MSTLRSVSIIMHKVKIKPPVSNKVTSADIFRLKLASILQSKVITIAKLSKKARVARETIYASAKGRYSPKMPISERIANALGFTLSEFIRLPHEMGEHDVEECMRRVQEEWKKRGASKR